MTYIIAIFFNINMLKKKSQEANFHFDQCCICGSKNCGQSIDHTKIQIQQLKSIIQSVQKAIPQIDKLKNSITTHFNGLRHQILASLQQKQKQILHWLNCFCFSHFQQYHVNIPLMSQILQGDLNRLPQKKLAKTIKYLKKYKSEKQSRPFQIDLDLLADDINNFITEIRKNDIVSKINNSIDLNLIIEPRKINLNNSFRSNTSTSSKISEEAIAPAILQYQWKHIRITKNTKTLQLNNRSIIDEDMIIQMPILQTFNNIKQFQIRNNKISSLSCALIANSLKFLKVLDIRGNKVGDQGITKIVNGIPKLKGLFISETNLTNIGGKQIVDGLCQLQTLWSQHNSLSGIISVQISKKNCLRILSLVGNPIDSYTCQQIKQIFLMKGYLAI